VVVKSGGWDVVMMEGGGVWRGGDGGSLGGFEGCLVWRGGSVLWVRAVGMVVVTQSELC